MLLAIARSPFEVAVIVSHKFKFIFVHLGRTGGRSLTAALAEHCEPDDIITAVPGLPSRNAASVRRHNTASQIRQHVGEKVWHEYFKFTFERNPWDKILSRYWRYAAPARKRAYKKTFEKVIGRPLSFREWFSLRIWQGRLFGLGHIRLPRHFHCYTKNGRVIVDFIGRFENRREHLQILSSRLGLPIDTSVWIGFETRKDRTPYTEHFDERMQRIVQSVFRQDLEFLGYAFGQPHPTNVLEGFAATKAAA
jgi:hypothetical protein